MAVPADLMISFKAMSATGFWNQLYKFGHAVYLFRYLAPFMIWCRPAVAAPKIYDFFKAVKKTEAKDLPVATAGFCWGGKFVTELCWYGGDPNPLHEPHADPYTLNSIGTKRKPMMASD